VRHGYGKSPIRERGGRNMPGIDGTGPMGFGPMTGRGLGMCITPVNALRYGTRAGRSLRRELELGLVPGIGRGMGLDLVSGLGRGLARGLLFGAILGLGYGCVRAYSRYFTADKYVESEKNCYKNKRSGLKPGSIG
jgi:hypothetical protein